MNEQTFVALLKEKGLSLDDLQLQQFRQYASILRQWNQVMDLTAICELEQIYEKHFYDSLLSSFTFSYQNQSILDVGSGAGFPGLVLKIAFPQLRVTLLEPTGKRCRFLNEVIQQLHLEGIQVVQGRAEDVIVPYREKFDLVTARAVAGLPILAELCAPFLKVNGTMIALKGSRGEEELLQSQNALKELGLELSSSEQYPLPEEGQIRILYYFSKTKNTPKKYPRNFGAIKKHPL